MSEAGNKAEEYSGVFAELYDVHPLYAARADVAFYVDEARRAAEQCARSGERAATPVLELGCGSGRVLLPTARAGVNIVGLDLAETMLARLRAKLARESEEVQRRVRVTRSNMTDFALGETFALITTPFRAFQHLLRVEEQLACLTCVKAHLAPGGRLILDFFHTLPAAMHDASFQEAREDAPWTPLPDGRSFHRTARIAEFHRATQTNVVEFFLYVRDAAGREEKFTERFPIRYFFHYEVEHLLARSGFRVTDVYGNFDRAPFADDSPEMIVMAEAP